MYKCLPIGIVTYHPSNSLIERLKKIYDYKIYIFDNSPEESSALRAISNVEYYHQKKNLGLGYGLFYLCSKAYYAKEEEILFFDQDTIFSLETLSYIKNYISENIDIRKKHSSVTFNNRSETPCDKERILTINSGTVFFLENLKAIGWHNPSYFVDCVDYEYCFRARQKGYLLLEHRCTPGFNHIADQDAHLISFFEKKYSLLRVYSKNRVTGTIKSSISLIMKSLKSLDFLFFFHISRFLFIYVISQIIANAVSILAFQKR